jgi:hypothetical protein
MLPIHPKRVVIAQHRVDFRKQWNGLLGECYRIGFDPYGGDCVVFVRSDRTQLRALTGDLRGLFLVARRFDGGSLGLDRIFDGTPQVKSITIAELALLLEGASFTVHRRVRQWRDVCVSPPMPVKHSEDSTVKRLSSEERAGGKGIAQNAARASRQSPQRGDGLA